MVQEKTVTVSDITKLLNSADKFATAVTPLVAAFGNKAIEAVAKYGPKAAEAAASAAKTVGSSAVKAGGAVADTAARLSDETKRVRDERKQSRIIRKAREDAVKSCIFSASAKEFKESYVADRSVGITNKGYMSLPGCFAIILLPNTKTRDYSKFVEVYVGSGLFIGDAVFEQLVGNGNADVYADVKYNQAVHILLYPCDEDQIEIVKASLILNFQAYGSYNARDVVNI